MKTINLLPIAPFLLAGQLAMAADAPLLCEPLGTHGMSPANGTQALGLVCERAATLDALEAAMLAVQRQLVRQTQTAQDHALLARVVALHGQKTECLMQVEQLKPLLEKPTLRLAPTELLLAQCPTP